MVTNLLVPASYVHPGSPPASSILKSNSSKRVGCLGQRLEVFSVMFVGLDTPVLVDVLPVEIK